MEIVAPNGAPPDSKTCALQQAAPRKTPSDRNPQPTSPPDRMRGTRRTARVCIQRGRSQRRLPRRHPVTKRGRNDAISVCRCCKSKLIWRFSFSPRDFSLVFFELGWAHKILASVGVPRPKKIFENHFPNEASMPALTSFLHTALPRVALCAASPWHRPRKSLGRHSFVSLLWYGSRQVSCRC